MSILSSVTTAVNPYLLYVKIGIAALVLGLILFLGWRDHSLGQQVGALKQTVKQAQADNAADVATIKQLSDANSKWVAQDAANKEALDELNSKLAGQATDLAGVRARLKVAQSTETTPAAVSLRSTRIDTVDPALAQRLRAEAAAH